MKSIIIKCLADKDLITAQTYNGIVPKDKNDFFKILNLYNTDKECLKITILAHGGQPGISNKPDCSDYIIFWDELCKAINQIKTVFPVLLNLTGICKSFHIENYLCNCPNIDFIWITTNCTEAIGRGCYAAQFDTLNDFLNDLDDDEKLDDNGINLYKQLK